MKIMKIKLLIGLITLCEIVNAQSPNWQWAKKTGSTSGEKCYSISTDEGGNLYTTGFFTSPIFFGSFPLANAGSADIFIAKYDSSGNIVWAKSFGGANDEGGFGISSDSVGNIYATGYFSSPSITFGSTTLTNVGGNDIFIVKLDATSGNVIWAISDGSTGDDRGIGVKADAYNNVYLTGSFASPTLNFGTTTLTNAGGYDVFIVKYAGATGNRLWAKSAGGVNDENGPNANDNGGTITTDPSGNVFAVGYFSSPAITLGSTTLTNTTGSYDLFIVKYDSVGNALWAKSAGGTGLNNDGAFGICTDVLGNAFVTGAFDSPSIIFGSFTLTHPLSTSGDIFTVKYDIGGNVVWAKNYGGIGDDIGYGICTDAQGYIYTAGIIHSDTATFGTFTLINSAAPSGDVFVAKYDASGNVLWAINEGGTNDDFAYDVALDTTSGTIYIAGNFASSSITFGATTLANSGFADIYVAKLNSIMTSVTETSSTERINIYPNPFSSTVIIHTDKFFNNANLTVYNLYGQQAAHLINIYGQTITLQRDNLPSGLYFFQLTQDSKIITIDKLVITD
jgi:hypothetical protein